MNKLEIITLIRSFLDGSAGPRDWDDFTSIPQTNKEVEALRRELLLLPLKYPPDRLNEYCGRLGELRLIEIADELEREIKNLAK